MGEAEVALPSVLLGARARGRRVALHRRVDLGQEAVWIDRRLHAIDLVRESIEAGRLALAIGVAAHGVQLDDLVQRVRGVEEAGADDGAGLADPHAEVVAGQAARIQLGLGRGLVQRVAHLVQEDDVGPRPGAVGLAPGQKLAGHVHEALRAQLHAAVGAQLELLAVALRGDPGLGVGVEGIDVVLEDDVEDAGDGVRAVLRGGAVAQHLDPGDGAGRDGVEIHAHGAAVVEVDQRALLAPLAVDQHEHVLRAQAAQAGRVDVIGPVRDGEVRRVERGGEGVEELVGLGLARLADDLVRDDVDRHRGLELGARRARADHDDRLAGAHVFGHLEVEAERGADLGHHRPRRIRLPGGLHPQHMVAGRHRERVPPLFIGERRGAGRLDRDGRPCLRRAVAAGHRARDRDLLLGRGWRRGEEQAENQATNEDKSPIESHAAPLSVSKRRHISMRVSPLRRRWGALVAATPCQYAPHVAAERGALRVRPARASGT